MSIVIFWMCAAMIAGVFGVMLYSVATFNAKPSAEVDGRSRSVTGELLWALVPILIFIVAAMPVVGSIAAVK
jgi:heme/copper-type cytochrome/quinol oxidase subunit 2